ncbi:MAG: cytochrome c biogenesis protein CcdA [Chloroflexi bacterium]|nr:cytochrome c biogenesis protein CcdA [Chloroflexota bacterium]
MDASNVSFGLALLAGLLSFLSPCVLSLVPAYIGYLGGRAVTTGGQQVESNRWLTFSHGIAFVLGMSFVLVFLIGVPTGLVVAFFGRADSQAEGFLYELKTALAWIGGLIVIVFGLHTMGVITIPFLESDTRKQVAPRSEISYLSSFMMGVFFTAGWSPCVGPVLTLIINMGLAAETTGRAVWRWGK